MTLRPLLGEMALTIVPLTKTLKTTILVLILIHSTHLGSNPNFNIIATKNLHSLCYRLYLCQFSWSTHQFHLQSCISCDRQFQQQPKCYQEWIFPQQRQIVLLIYTLREQARFYLQEPFEIILYKTLHKDIGLKSRMDMGLSFLGIKTIYVEFKLGRNTP